MCSSATHARLPQPGAPPLKGDIPVVLLMGESSDITEIDLSSIEDY